MTTLRLKKNGKTEETPQSEVQTMDFSDALLALKNGQRVARSGWNGKGMFLYLVPGSEFHVSRLPLLGIYPKGTRIKYHAHIDVRSADVCAPWCGGQEDMLADDWTLVTPTAA